MGSIYKDSVLNISADAASDAFQGIFQSCDRNRVTKDPALRLPCQSICHGVQGHLFIRKTPGPDVSGDKEFFGCNSLDTRAWVFQESIRYAARQLVWSCRSASFLEEDPVETIKSSAWQSTWAISIKAAFFDKQSLTL